MKQKGTVIILLVLIVFTLIFITGCVENTERSELDVNDDLESTLSDEEISKSLKKCDGYLKAKYEPNDDVGDAHLGRCYIEIAKKNNAVNVCDKIKYYEPPRIHAGASQRDECYRYFIEKTGDSSYCNDIKETYYTNKCLSEFGT